MTTTLDFLKELITRAGLSGHESRVADLVRETWKPLVDETSFSRLGSLHAFRRGQAPEPRPSLLVATHMDAIGFMVTAVVDGFLRLTAIGGIDARVLPGQLVTVHASGGRGLGELPAVIVQPPARLLPDGAGDGPVALEYLLADPGLPTRKAESLIKVGDLVSFAQEPLELSGTTLAGHSLDNRASVAALTVCLEELRSRPLAWDLWAVATTQEEVTLGGAQTSAFQLNPSLAIIIDVTWAKGPGANDWNTFPLGKGPTLGWGPNLHPALHKAFKELAEKLEIPHAVEVMPRHSGTDAFAIQVTAEGIPCLVLGIPLRYMHTPVELVSLKDIQRTGRLLAEFISGLEPDFLEQITWE